MAMTKDQLVLLKSKLQDTFVQHLPPLLDKTTKSEHQQAKNISRAFAAFALHKLCGVDHVTAAKAVVDDYEDNGLDAIYYHQVSRRLYLVQGKLKEDESFKQPDAMSFTKGVRDLLKQDYGVFNKNVQERQNEIEAALDDCNQIILVVAHTSDTVAVHAVNVLQQFLGGRDDIDERLTEIYTDYGPNEVLRDLLDQYALHPVDDIVTLYGCEKVNKPRITYYGQAKLKDLANLFVKHGNALLDKNIRHYLGVETSGVNREIHRSLKERPEQFFYLNNGVTAVARDISPKSTKESSKKFFAKGLSIINGAQTVASASECLVADPVFNIDKAYVFFTLIHVPDGDEFGAEVTKARNYQNPISPTNFAALDPAQERLRRELEFFDIQYLYRPESRRIDLISKTITIEDAAAALALFSPVPDFPIILKNEPSRLLDRNGKEYERLFNSQLSGRRLSIAVCYYRQALSLMQEHEMSASGEERLFYRHGRNAVIWLVFQENKSWLQNLKIPTDAEAAAMLSAPLDTWRQKVWDIASSELSRINKGPLAFFRNLTDAKPFLLKLSSLTAKK